MSSNPADLRAAAERGAKAERELAFRKAGVNVDTGPGRLLLDSYAGALNAADIQRAAQRYGIGADDFGDEPPAYTDEERSQTRERAGLAANSEVPTGMREDPVATGYAEFHRARADGAAMEDAATHVVGRIFAAAFGDKDPRFVHDQKAYVEAHRGSSKAR